MKTTQEAFDDFGNALRDLLCEFCQAIGVFKLLDWMEKKLRKRGGE